MTNVEDRLVTRNSTFFCHSFFDIRHSDLVGLADSTHPTVTT
jgi:hypothetical protein